MVERTYYTARRLERYKDIGDRDETLTWPMSVQLVFLRLGREISSMSAPTACRRSLTCAVLYPCLSYSSDDHHLIHSCLGTGARVGTQNRFRLYRASLVHPVSSIALLLVLVFWCEQYYNTATSGIEYSVLRILDRSCPVCVGKHETVNFVKDFET